VLGVAALVTRAGRKCSAARVALGGLLPHARRASEVERAIVGSAGDEASIGAAATRVVADLGDDVTGDLYASAEYRAAMAPVFVKRALAAALARAGAA
jgi:carbon-monoxide dehydrogenase medium subunit